MKQRTCAIQDSFDAVKFLDEIKKSSDYKNAKSVLVNIFTRRVQKDYISYITCMVKKTLDKANISGLTCLQGFAQGEKISGPTIITVLLFEKSEIDLLEIDFSKTPVEEAKEAFLNKFNSLHDLRAIQVFTTPLNNKITNEFMAACNTEDSNIPIFGAGAGFEAGSVPQKLLVFGREVHKSGIIITFFRGKNLKVYAESTLGWTPVGKKMQVTEVIDNHILKTIDNLPAADIYKNYLGVTSSKNFLENTCEFPFMLKRAGKWLARIPITKDDKGCIHFTADIKKGEELVFSYGAKKIILQHSFNLAEYMSRKNLEGLILHVCKNRLSYLKEDELLELQAFSNFYRETAGCFAFAEILYKNQSGGLQNSAMLAIGFKEVEDPQSSDFSEDCYVEDFFYGNSRFIDFNKFGTEISLNNKNDKLIPFEDRLVNFLHATSRDLYLANLKLEEIATTDGLTKLFNRKKIAETINYELSRRNFRNISLIMFDIDNFKKVNDTYGHDTGDEVLVRVAQTAKACIRERDSIGRWGGEEFMILLPDTAKENALSIAERIRKEVHNLQWEKMPQITISLGLAALRDDDDNQSFYKRVDNCLYYSKTHGKNQVTSDDKL